MRILITAGGTATAWHIINVLKNYFIDIEVVVTDTNPRHLVHSSIMANYFEQVPAIIEKDYYVGMLELMQKYKVQIIIPIIDFDLLHFPCDNIDLINLGIKSTAPDMQTCKDIANKEKMAITVEKHGINVPKMYNIDDISDEQEYFIKPKFGFGSRGSELITGNEINVKKVKDMVIQEVCSRPEITVEIFSYNNFISTVCRERIETKSGVCTKARIFYDEEFNEKILKIAKFVKLPVASCIQFMKNSNYEWCLTDFNLRLGAGTALSSAVGFELTKAAIACWMGKPEIASKFLKKPNIDRFVVRTFNEVITK